jgi:hypothetical protein
MKNKLLWLLLAVIAFDFGVTLVGQPSSYWSNAHTAREANPLFAWFMVRGITWYFFLIVTYMVSVSVLLRVLPRQSATVTGLVFLLSHYFAACTWLTLRFDLGMTGPVIYATVLSIALVSIFQSGSPNSCISQKGAWPFNGSGGLATDQFNIRQNMNLNGCKMHVVQTAPNGLVGRDTVFEFAQEGDIVTASYSGGRVRVGYLVGILKAATLSFRYCQVSDEDHVDGGFSNARVESTNGGRLRLIESFKWESRDGSGENIFEEIGREMPNQSTDPTLASGTPGAGHQPRHPWLGSSQGSLRSMDEQPPLFVVILGFINIVTFIGFAFCFASLRSDVDDEKLRAEPNIAKVFAAGIPPERLLTKKGKRKIKICKVALIVWALETAVLVVYSHWKGSRWTLEPLLQRSNLWIRLSHQSLRLLGNRGTGRS